MEEKDKAKKTLSDNGKKKEKGDLDDFIFHKEYIKDKSER